MSNFVVSARKYRPLRFDEVVGQQHVSQTLKNALQNQQLAHAFLFCGPRGVGKTTCARILAKVLNCQNPTEEHEACNECSSCKAFNENASFNITELDAASNNSVDHIRALIEQVRFQPQQGKYKVFIIDEVHMLSQQAFNAFLKTLEEPPPYAIFILATTEKHKIIPTILSRCQIFDFRRIQVADIVTHLQEICEKENINADKDALHIIAQKADGALRDALSIFDRIVSSVPAEKGRRSITYEHVIEHLNVLDYDYFFKIIDGMLTESVADVLLIFDDILKKGFESDIFINGLAEHFRNLLICKDPQTIPLLEVSDTLQARYKQQAHLTPASFLLTALNIANDCDVNFKMARNKRLHVEMALIKMTFINRAVKLASLQNTASGSPAEKPSSLQTEKKTHDGNGSPTKKNSTIESGTPALSQVREEPPVSKPLKAESTTEQPSTTPKLETVSVATSHDTPRLVDLSDLEEEFENETEESAIPDKEIPLENFLEAWNKYAENIKSPSVRTTISKAEFELNGETIRVTVGSTMAKEMVQQETDLMQFIRDQLGRQGLIMEVLIDPDKLPEEAKVKPKKLLSTKEKYDLMRKENPLIDDMRKRFDLKPDYD